jgi:hypothetical protein
MGRWARERADHVFDNAVERAGPIIRSRAVDAGDPSLHVAEELGVADAIRCPTCDRVLPGVASACPDDGTELELAGRCGNSGR